MFEAFSRSLVDFFLASNNFHGVVVVVLLRCALNQFLTIHRASLWTIKIARLWKTFTLTQTSCFFVSYHPWSNRLRKNNRGGGWVCFFSINFSKVLRKWSEVNWNNKKVNNFLASHFSPLKTACKLWLLVERDVLSSSTISSGFKLCTTRFDLPGQGSTAPRALLVTVPLFILWQVRNNLRHRISHFLALVCAELVYF